MIVLVHVFLMVVLIRLLTLFDSPRACVVAYMACWLGLKLMESGADVIIFSAFAVVLVVSWGYFLGLSKVRDSLLWWAMAVAGNVAVLLAGEVTIGLLVNAREAQGAVG